MKILLKPPIIAHRTRLSTKPKYGRHQKSAVKPDFRIIGVRISESVLYIAVWVECKTMLIIWGDNGAMSTKE